MSETKQTIRQKLHALAEELPADASWDDVIEEARFRKAVELGSQPQTEALLLPMRKCAMPFPVGA